MAVAVQPRLLGGAIAQVLASAGVDDVVSRDQFGAGHVDAAVVTGVLPDLLEADVIVELPDSASGTGLGQVRTARGVEPIQIDGTLSILEVLDRYCPGPTSRLAHDGGAT